MDLVYLKCNKNNYIDRNLSKFVPEKSAVPEIIIIIIIKKDWQCKDGRERLTPYQSEDRSPTLPTYRGKEEKGKIVEDKT